MFNVIFRNLEYIIMRMFVIILDYKIGFSVFFVIMKM